ncbi:MAG TPA: hypothetical protein VKE93_03095 [Candidatus Angelobacter sp.]|nr:hypothetical protein [Candidatus Angelobacter sp.]
MKKRIFSLCVVVLLTGTGLLCAQQTDSWKEYVYNDDGFAISASVEPQIVRNPKSHIYVSKGSSKEKLAVLVMNVSGPEEELRDMIKRTLTAAAGVVPSSIEEIKFAGVPAFRAQKQVGGQLYTMRSFEAGGRVFLLEAPDAPEGERFINSFRLVDQQWKEYSYADDGFILSSPAEPQLETISSTRTYTIDLPHGDGFKVMVLPAPARPDGGGAKDTLRRFRDRFLNDMRWKLITETDVPGEVPAIAFELETPYTGAGAHMHGRMYYGESKIYFLLAKGHPDAARFFDAFRLSHSH